MNPSLPQEILDLIIDMIALEAPRTSKHTLRTCSVVSTAFKHRSRKHLFSEIEFLSGDEHAQRRAKRLFKALSRPSNQLLILNILSFKIIIGIPEEIRRRLQSPGQGIVAELYWQAWGPIQRISKKLGIRRNYLQDILQLLSRSPLQKFAIEVPNWFQDWNKIRDHCAFPVLFSIRTHPHLKSLSLVNMYNVDRSFIFVEEANRIGGLRELRLWDVTMRGSSMPYQFLNAETQSLGGLEHLHIRTTEEYSHILPTRSSSACFPSLRTLVVGMPRDPEQIPGLWNMIKNFASTLTSLEIQDIWWLESSPPLEETPMFLSDLPNLQNLKLCASCKGPVYYVSLETMSHLLASATSPLPIEHISIELELASAFVDGIPHINWRQSEILESSAALDRTLTSPMLVNLRSLDFALKLVNTGPSVKRVDIFPQSMYPIDDTYVRRRLLPSASVFPSIDFEDSIEILH